MNRRRFLRTSLTTLAFSSAPPAFANSKKGRPRPQIKPFELDELTISDLQAGLHSGRWSIRSVTEKYLARIHEIDRTGPRVNSVIELNPDAEAIARQLDREWRSGKSRGPLHGVPVLIKDNINTHDRMSTSAGSLALDGWAPSQDAFLVGKLRAAGAVILGKANLSEWANFRSRKSTSGWSARGGLTRNPYALDRNPCGSSSGSGAAVSANLCLAAVGTETDGSIVCPSSVNGIVGIKPTLGLISRSGIIPIAHSQDTAGPMTRTVHDAAILLSAMTGADPADSATTSANGKAHPDYTVFLDPNGLRGSRIGVARRFFGFSEKVDILLSAVLEQMKEAGAILIDPVVIPGAGKFGASEFEVLLYEFKADLNAYLAKVSPNLPARSLAELITFNEQNKEKEMPYFGQDIFERAQSKGPLTDKAYLEALAQNHRLSRDEGIDAAFKEHQLDAILAPTTGPAAPTDLVNGDHLAGGSSSLAAVAGYPSITVPAGQIFGLPFGVSFFGTAFSEPKLLRIAYGFERLTRARRSPQFLPSIPA